MDIVIIAGFIVVSLSIFDSKAFVPREGEVLIVLRSVGIVLKVIFHMALAADE